MIAPLIVALLAASPDETTEHRGSLGLVVASGGLIRSLSGATKGSFGVPVDVGVTAGVLGEHTELIAAGRFFFGEVLGAAAYAGIRSSFGRDAFKTFLDAQLAAHFVPDWTVGARLGLGAQWDFSSIAGVFAAAAFQVGFGSTILLQGEVLVGVQFRTYVFDH